MTRERFTRRSVLGLIGGTLAVAATAPAFALAQSGATPEATGAIEHPTGADDIVLRIEVKGGFVPPQVTLSEVPQFSLYGDGRVITTGPMIDIFPSPALPNLRQAQLTETGIQEVLAAAAAAGLLDGDKSYFNNTVADAPTTVFTVNAGGKTSTVSAYGLGFGDDSSWTAEEGAAIAKLQVLAGQSFDVTSWVDPANVAAGDEPYPIDRLQVVAAPMTSSDATPDPNDPTANQPPMDWPLSTSIADAAPITDVFGPDQGYSCGVISGTDAATLLAAAQKANVLTPWLSEDTRYILWLRPLLPDETGCPPQGPAATASPVASS